MLWVLGMTLPVTLTLCGFLLLVPTEAASLLPMGIVAHVQLQNVLETQHDSMLPQPGPAWETPHLPAHPSSLLLPQPPNRLPEPQPPR